MTDEPHGQLTLLAIGGPLDGRMLDGRYGRARAVIGVPPLEAQLDLRTPTAAGREVVDYGLAAVTIDDINDPDLMAVVQFYAILTPEELARAHDVILGTWWLICTMADPYRPLLDPVAWWCCSCSTCEGALTMPWAEPGAREEWMTGHAAIGHRTFTVWEETEEHDMLFMRAVTIPAALESAEEAHDG